MDNKLIPYQLPCGCSLRFIPNPLVAGPPSDVEQFTCAAHADIGKALEALHKPAERSK